jgi:hypothetical protein
MRVVVTVLHWNGYSVRGVISRGDAQGIFVDRLDGSAPIFCDFFNVERIEMTK